MPLIATAATETDLFVIGQTQPTFWNTPAYRQMVWSPNEHPQVRLEWPQLSDTFEAGDDIDLGDPEHRRTLLAYLDGRGASGPADDEDDVADEDDEHEYRRLLRAYLEEREASRPADDNSDNYGTGDDVDDPDPNRRCMAATRDCQPVARPTVNDLARKIFTGGRMGRGGLGSWKGFKTLYPAWTGGAAHTPPCPSSSIISTPYVRNYWRPAAEAPSSTLLTGFPTVVSAMTESTGNMEDGVRRTVAHVLIRAMDLWTLWDQARPVSIHEPDRLHPHDWALALDVRRVLDEEPDHRTLTATGWRNRVSPLAAVDVAWDAAEPLDAVTADACLPQILDQVLWASAMALALRWVKRRVEPPSRCRRRPSLPFDKPESPRGCPADRGAWCGATSIWGDVSRQTMGLLMMSAFVHLIFHGLALLAETGRYTHAVIDRLSEALVDPGLEFRARLNVCAQQWATMEPDN
ncbi:MAG: hypothetical protein M1826_000832 [Phylliscum demangeonii]|nr:MAG: hypothetical protein M1826_000832 [Phylliscum demangeonii]